MDSAVRMDCAHFPLQAPATTARRRVGYFVGFVAFVAAVSVYDGYLVVRTGDLIVECELNPIGLYLIQYNHDDASLFLRLKAAGTVLALTSLSLLWRQAPRLANPVAFILVLFQAGLLVFLEMPA